MQHSRYLLSASGTRCTVAWDSISIHQISEVLGQAWESVSEKFCASEYLTDPVDTSDDGVHAYVPD